MLVQRSAATNSNLLVNSLHVAVRLGHPAVRRPAHRHELHRQSSHFSLDDVAHLAALHLPALLVAALSPVAGHDDLPLEDAAAHQRSCISPPRAKLIRHAIAYYF